MRKVLQLAVLAVLAACGESTGGSGGQEGVLDRMIQTSGQLTFHVGDSYVFAEHWQAIDGIGQQMSLDSTEARALGIRYSLGDSVTAGAAVDSTGAFTLQAPFIGFLYVFGPTLRDSRERLGQHYIDVEP
jgi:hypothetical protein